MFKRTKFLDPYNLTLEKYFMDTYRVLPAHYICNIPKWKRIIVKTFGVKIINTNGTVAYRLGETLLIAKATK